DDPRDFSMLCFGGGGAMFGAHLMDELSLPAAIVPILPSAFSAWGMLMVDLRHDVVQTIVQRLDGIEAGKLEEHFAALEKKGWEQLVREAVPEDRRQLFRSADMRYAGQEHSVSVPVPASLAGPDSMQKLYEAFQTVYESVYGYRLSAPADIVTLRVKAIGTIPAPSLKPIERGGPDLE